ncbi:hypothetical protein WMF04_01350 [Sorangium sp. So ce260]
MHVPCSSGWVWAKALHVIEANPAVARAAVTLLDHRERLAGVTREG